jgi:hypothetical protein
VQDEASTHADPQGQILVEADGRAPPGKYRGTGLRVVVDGQARGSIHCALDKAELDREPDRPKNIVYRHHPSWV